MLTSQRLCDKCLKSLKTKTKIVFLGFELELVMGTDRNAAPVCRYRYLNTFSVGISVNYRYAIEHNNTPNYCNNVRGQKHKKTHPKSHEKRRWSQLAHTVTTMLMR